MREVACGCSRTEKQIGPWVEARGDRRSAGAQHCPIRTQRRTWHGAFVGRSVLSGLNNRCSYRSIVSDEIQSRPHKGKCRELKFPAHSKYLWYSGCPWQCRARLNHWRLAQRHSIPAQPRKWSSTFGRTWRYPNQIRCHNQRNFAFSNRSYNLHCFIQTNWWNLTRSEWRVIADVITSSSWAFLIKRLASLHTSIADALSISYFIVLEWVANITDYLFIFS